jgi:tetratricopeptide (TPR) repeat protein
MPQNRLRVTGGVVLLACLLSATAAVAQAPAAKPQGKRTPLEILQTAHALFLQKDFEAAREHYLEVLPSFPKNFDVLKNLATCYYRRGPRGYAQAAQYYARALEIQPDSVECAETLARCYEGLGRQGEAGAVYERMARQPGAASTYWRKAADSYAAADHFRQAESAYDAYLQRNPGDLSARVRLGDLLARQKDYARAQEQYRIVLSSNPSHPQALIGMGRLTSYQGRHEEALKFYDRALRASPRNGEAETAKAFTLLWIDRYDESRALFQDLLKRHPRNSELARGLEQAEDALRRRELAEARSRGDVAKIESYYRDRLAKNPKDTSALRALAEASLTPERCQESIELSRKGLEIMPGDAGFESRLARALVTCQQYDEGIAHYQRAAKADPHSAGLLTELGSTLLRTRRHAEAVQAFRAALQVRPESTDAKLGLALALAANKNYDEALAAYNEVLKVSPNNYDALQGKAFVLSWTGHYAESRAIFQSLASRKPDDAQNTEALRRIESAEEEKKWQALRPGSDATPEAWIAYYDQRLAAYPGELSSLKGRAYQLSKGSDHPATIAAYRQVLAANPDDVSAKRELARFLARERQYDEAIRLYSEVIAAEPDDLSSLETLARVQGWAGRENDSLAGYQKLLAAKPGDVPTLMEMARLQLRKPDYTAARTTLNQVIAAEPQNRDAHLQLARLDLREANRTSALAHYEEVLKQDPNDPTALQGKAQILYHQGNKKGALAFAEKAVAANPNSFDSVFLLATIERSLRHKKRTNELLDRAEQLSPGNSEVAAMRRRMRDESAVTLSTRTAFAREIGPETQIGAQTGFPNQDLRSFSYGATLGFSFLPNTDSYVAYSANPTEAPPGPRRDSSGNQIPTGITGTVVPHLFLYRQRTRISDQWTFRAGVGAVRFGPGTLTRIAGVPGSFGLSAKSAPVGEVGLTYRPNKHLTWDIVDIGHTPITHTPTATKYGVMRSRFGTGLTIDFDDRTELTLSYDYAHYRSATISGTDYRDNSHFGEIDFNRVIATSQPISLDLGAEFVRYGFAGRDRGVFMGFYNPEIYQRYLLTTRIYGKLSGPVGYELAGGFGIRQSDRNGPYKAGGRISPSFTFRVNDHFSFGIGYTHYNDAQVLGTLRGNAFRLTTDWKF